MIARVQVGEIEDFVYQFSIPLFISDDRKKTWKYWKADFAVPAVGWGKPKFLVGDQSKSAMGAAGLVYFYNVIEIHESKGWNRSDETFRLKLNICLRNYPDLPVYVNKVRVKFTPSGRIVLRPRRKRMVGNRFLRGF